MDSVTQTDDGSLVSKRIDYIITSVMASNIVDDYSFYKPIILLVKLPAYIAYHAS